MMMQLRKTQVFLLVALGLSIAGIERLSAQEGQLVDVVVHSAAVEGNLLDDSADRNVTVYLPPGYDEDTARNYPVLYLLHGYTGTNEVWFSGNSFLGAGNIREIADALIESGAIQPLIIVMPDARNKYLGSYYTDSPVTGNWEAFITAELVNFIDHAYRTLPQIESRGIAGHSMGGYGALKLAMKHPETYSAVYGLSACCLGFSEREAAWTMNDDAWKSTLQLDAANQFAGASFGSQLQIAMAAAFTPNAESTFLGDFPFEMDGENIRKKDAVWEQWFAEMPLGMVASFGANFKQLHGVRFDVGTSDAFPHIPTDSRALSAALDGAGIPHVFEEYDGGHSDRIFERLETEVLPFFSETLQSETNTTAVETSTWGTLKSKVGTFAQPLEKVE